MNKTVIYHFITKNKMVHYPKIETNSICPDIIFLFLFLPCLPVFLISYVLFFSVINKKLYFMYLNVKLKIKK